MQPKHSSCRMNFRMACRPLDCCVPALDYALNDHTRLGGVFEAVKAEFKVKGGRDLLLRVTKVNDLRNHYVAHQEERLTDQKLAAGHLGVVLVSLSCFMGW